MKRIPAVVLAAAAIAAACGDRAARVPAPTDFHGVGMIPPIAKPDFTFTATDGKPFDFRARTSGKLALLFFGYTNCPDVCPVHAANVAAVLRDLSWADRQRVMFVFVSTDPARDSLPAIRAWLDHFDSSFVGLRGPIDSVNALALKLMLPGAALEQKAKDGTYGVGHSAVVLAFSADDSARVMYPFGVRQQDWAADIPKLLTIKPR
jgi:protein SCO1/2